MKNTFFLLIILLLSSIVSCQDDRFSLTHNDEKEMIVQTRATSTLHENIPFVWYDSNSPKICIGVDSIILPFYSGAPGPGFPEYIATDYRKADGWEMVYNFITDPELQIPNRNMFILYNKFRGKLRIFYYNTLTPTIGKTTFAKISINESSSKLFNNSSVGIYCLPHDQTGPQSVFTTNIVNIGSESLCLGWNCFDLELSYDNSYIANPDKSTELSIGFFDQIVLDVKLNGISNTLGNLSYVETSSSNPVGDFAQSVFSAGGTAFGAAAENAILSQKSDTTSNTVTRSAILTAIIGKVVSAGVSNLVSSITKSWTSSFAKQTNTYKTIDIKMSSKINIGGAITGTLSSAGIGAYNLPIPGSKPDGDATVKPIYKAPLGVWSLKTVKTVKIGDHIFPTIENLSGYPTSPESYPVVANLGEYVQIIAPTYGIDDVIINDSVMSCISKYEVKSEVFYAKRNNGEIAINDSVLMNHSKIWIRNNSDKYYPYIQNNYQINQSYWLLFNSANYSRRGTSDIYFNPEYFKFITRVTVLLYPKSPYNTDVISLTRTFQCNTEKVTTPSFGRAKIGSYN